MPNYVYAHKYTHIYSVKYECVSRQYVPSAKIKAQSHLLVEIVMAKYR